MIRRVVRRWSGNRGGLPAGGMKWASFAEGAGAKEVSTDSAPVRSDRRSGPRDSGPAAGMVGSPDWHSQGAEGPESRASPAGRAVSGPMGRAFAGQQQHFESGAAMQHDLRAPDFPLRVPADAPPDIKSIPTTAARANPGSRRWGREGVKASPRSRSSDLPATINSIHGRRIRASRLLDSPRRLGRRRSFPDMPEILRLPTNFAEATRPAHPIPLRGRWKRLCRLRGDARTAMAWHGGRQ